LDDYLWNFCANLIQDGQVENLLIWC